MSKLPTVTARQAIAVFGVIGYHEVRQSGSHVTLKRDGERLVLTVPCHGNKDLKPGLLRSLIRTAGLTVEEFIDKL